LPTPHPKLRIAQARGVTVDWLEDLLTWESAPVMADEAVRIALARWVPEYQPNLHASMYAAPPLPNPSTPIRTSLSDRQGDQS
jgi:hypothetical protein